MRYFLHIRRHVSDAERRLIHFGAPHGPESVRPPDDAERADIRALPTAEERAMQIVNDINGLSTDVLDRQFDRQREKKVQLDVTTDQVMNVAQQKYNLTQAEVYEIGHAFNAITQRLARTRNKDSLDFSRRRNTYAADPGHKKNERITIEAFAKDSQPQRPRAATPTPRRTPAEEPQPAQVPEQTAPQVPEQQSSQPPYVPQQPAQPTFKAETKQGPKFYMKKPDQPVDGPQFQAQKKSNEQPFKSQKQTEQSPAQSQNPDAYFRAFSQEFIQELGKNPTLISENKSLSNLLHTTDPQQIDAIMKQSIDWVKQNPADADRVFVAGLLQHFRNQPGDRQNAQIFFRAADRMKPGQAHVRAFLSPSTPSRSPAAPRQNAAVERNPVEKSAPAEPVQPAPAVGQQAQTKQNIPQQTAAPTTVPQSEYQPRFYSTTNTKPASTGRTSSPDKGNTPFIAAKQSVDTSPVAPAQVSTKATSSPSSSSDNSEQARSSDRNEAKNKTESKETGPSMDLQRALDEIAGVGQRAMETYRNPRVNKSIADAQIQQELIGILQRNGVAPYFINNGRNVTWEADARGSNPTFALNLTSMTPRLRQEFGKIGKVLEKDGSFVLRLSAEKGTQPKQAERAPRQAVTFSPEERSIIDKIFSDKAVTGLLVQDSRPSKDVIFSTIKTVAKRELPSIKDSTIRLIADQYDNMRNGMQKAMENGSFKQARSAGIASAESVKKDFRQGFIEADLRQAFDALKNQK